MATSSSASDTNTASSSSSFTVVCPVCMENPVDGNHGITLGPCNHTVCTVCAINFIRFALDKAAEGDYFEKLTKEYQTKIRHNLLGTFGSGTSSLHSLLGPIACPICVNSDLPVGAYPQGWITEDCISKLSPLPLGQITRTFTNDGTGSTNTPSITTLSKNEVARYMRSVNACAIVFGNNDNHHHNDSTSNLAASSSFPDTFTLATLTSDHSATKNSRIRVCPNHRCEEILLVNDLVTTPSSIDSSSSPSTTFEPIMRTCSYCQEHLCSGCGLPWIEHSLGERHFGRSCEQWAALLVDSDAATRSILNNTRGRKQCGRCGYLVERWRGHACHHVKCKCGAEMCYVCMEDWKGECPNKCPFRCSLECSCVPCIDCKPGKPCQYCSGDCPSCRGETEEEALERERQESIAQRAKMSTGWCGPRQTWRKDVVASSSTASEAAELAAATSRPKTAKDIIRILARAVNTYSYDECMIAEVLRTFSVLLGNPSVRMEEKVTVFDALQLWQPNLVGTSSQSSSNGGRSSPSLSGSNGILQSGVPAWMSMYNLYPHSDEVLAAAIEFIYVSSAAGRSGGGDTGHFQVEHVRTLFERVLNLCIQYKDTIFTSKSSTYYNILLHSIQTITEAFAPEPTSSSSSSGSPTKPSTSLKLNRRSWATKLVHANAPELLCEILSLAVTALNHAQREEEESATTVVRTPSGKVKKAQSPAQMRAWALIRYAINTITAFMSMAFDPEAPERFMAKIALDKIISCHGISFVSPILEAVGRDLNSQKSITGTHWSIITLATKIFMFKESDNISSSATGSGSNVNNDTAKNNANDNTNATTNTEFRTEGQRIREIFTSIGLSKLLKLCRKSTSLHATDRQMIDSALVTLLIAGGDITPSFGRFLGKSARKELVRAECDVRSVNSINPLPTLTVLGDLLSRTDESSYGARLVAVTEFLRKKKPDDDSDDEDNDDEEDDMHSDFVGSSTEDSDGDSDNDSDSDEDSAHDGSSEGDETLNKLKHLLEVLSSDSDGLSTDDNDNDEESKVSENDEGTNDLPMNTDTIQLELPSSLTNLAIKTSSKCKFCKRPKTETCKTGCKAYIDVATKHFRKVIGKREQDTFPLKPTDSSHSRFVSPRYGAEILIQALACAGLWSVTGVPMIIKRVSVALGQHIINVLATPTPSLLSPFRTKKEDTDKKSLPPTPPSVPYGDTVTFDALTRVAGIAIEYGMPGLEIVTTGSSEESSVSIVEKHPNGLTSFALLYLRLIAEELSFLPGYTSVEYSLNNYLVSDNATSNITAANETVHRNIQNSLLHLRPLFTVLQNEIQSRSTTYSSYLTPSTFPCSFPLRYFLTSFATISECFRVGINGTDTTPFYRPSEELQSVDSLFGSHTLYYQPQAIAGCVRIMHYFIKKYHGLPLQELAHLLQNPDKEFTFYRTFLHFFIPHYSALILACSEPYSASDRHRNVSVFSLNSGLKDIVFLSIDILQNLVSYLINNDEATKNDSSSLLSLTNNFFDDALAMVDAYTLCTMVSVRRTGTADDALKTSLTELVEKLAVLMADCYQIDNFTIRPIFIRTMNQCVMARPSGNYLFKEDGPLCNMSSISNPAKAVSEYLVPFERTSYRIFSYIFWKNFIERKGLDGYLQRMRKLRIGIKTTVTAPSSTTDTVVISTPPSSSSASSAPLSKYTFSEICGLSFGVFRSYANFSQTFATTYFAAIRDIFLDSITALSSEQLLGIDFDDVSTLFDSLYNAQSHFVSTYGDDNDVKKKIEGGTGGSVTNVDPEKLKNEKEKLKLACLKCTLSDPSSSTTQRSEVAQNLYSMCSDACASTNVLRPRSESSKIGTAKEFFIMVRDNNFIDLLLDTMDNMSLDDLYSYVVTLYNGYDSFGWRSDANCFLEYTAQFTRDYQTLKLCYPGSTLLEGLEGCGLQFRHLQKMVEILYKVAKQNIEHSAEYVLRKGLIMVTRRLSVELHDEFAKYLQSPDYLPLIYKRTRYSDMIAKIAEHGMTNLNLLIDTYVNAVKQEEEEDKDPKNTDPNDEDEHEQESRIRTTMLPEYLRSFMEKDNSIFGYRTVWAIVSTVGDATTDEDTDSESFELESSDGTGTESSNDSTAKTPINTETDGTEKSKDVPSLIPSSDVRSEAASHLETCFSKIETLSILHYLLVQSFLTLKNKQGTGMMVRSLLYLHDRAYTVIESDVDNAWNRLEAAETKENERLKKENVHHKDSKNVTEELKVTMEKDAYRKFIEALEKELETVDGTAGSSMSNIASTGSSSIYLGAKLFDIIATDMEHQITVYKEAAIRKSSSLNSVYVMGQSFYSNMSSYFSLIGGLVLKDNTCQISVSAIERIWDSLVDLPHDSIVNHLLDEFSGFCCNTEGTCWHGIPPESALALLKRIRSVENRIHDISTSTFFTCAWNLLVDANAGVGMIKGRDDYRHYPAIDTWKLKGIDEIWESFLHSTLNSVSDTMVPLLCRLFLHVPESLPLGTLDSESSTNEDTKIKVWATLIRKCISGIHRAIEMDKEKKKSSDSADSGSTSTVNPSSSIDMKNDTNEDTVKLTDAIVSLGSSNDSVETVTNKLNDTFGQINFSNLSQPLSFTIMRVCFLLDAILKKFRTSYPEIDSTEHKSVAVPLSIPTIVSTVQTSGSSKGKKDSLQIEKDDDNDTDERKDDTILEQSFTVHSLFNRSSSKEKIFLPSRLEIYVQQGYETIGEVRDRIGEYLKRSPQSLVLYSRGSLIRNTLPVYYWDDNEIISKPLPHLVCEIYVHGIHPLLKARKKATTREERILAVTNRRRCSTSSGSNSSASTETTNDEGMRNETNTTTNDKVSTVIVIENALQSSTVVVESTTVVPDAEKSNLGATTDTCSNSASVPLSTVVTTHRIFEYLGSIIAQDTVVLNYFVSLAADLNKTSYAHSETRRILDLLLKEYSKTKTTSSSSFQSKDTEDTDTFEENNGGNTSDSGTSSTTSSESNGSSDGGSLPSIDDEDW